MANVFVVSGNLVRDPEVISLNSGTEKGTFRIVNNRRFKTKDGEKREESVGFDVECWGGIIKVLEYLKKGSGVIISGRIRENSWEDKETGQKRHKYVVVAEDIDFMDKAKSKKSEKSSDQDEDEEKEAESSNMPF